HRVFAKVLPVLAHNKTPGSLITRSVAGVILSRNVLFQVTRQLLRTSSHLSLQRSTRLFRETLTRRSAQFNAAVRLKWQTKWPAPAYFNIGTLPPLSLIAPRAIFVAVSYPASAWRRMPIPGSEC